MIFNIAHSPALPTFTCSFNPTVGQHGRWKPPSKPPTFTAASLPAARDRVIDFGKYKGKMLGALPSSYLKWVSGNLRSGDTHDWAHLADQVLQDPVYQDRLEWEFASRVLNANDGSVPSSASSGNGVVAQLLEISQRFGWDNDDKVGWSRVNFELLGTSKGGRIPRLGFGKEEKVGLRADEEDRGSGGRGRISGGNGELESEERRRERRERMRLRKAAAAAATARMEKERLGITGKTEARSVNDRQFGGRGEDLTTEINGRFPGREGLLKKVLDGKRYL